MRMHGASASFADLRQRIVSAVVLGGAALGLLWLGGAAAAGLIAGIAGAMAWEWRRMTLPGAGIGAHAGPVVAMAGGVLVAHVAGYPQALGWLVVVLVLVAMADMARRRGFAALWLLAGGLYLGLSCIALFSLREIGPYGFQTVLWVILVVAASDIGGYFGGRLVGGAKLWPAVSPKKTWAGLAGGVGLAFVLGGVFSWATTGTYFQEVCTVSALAALLAQGGDLAESAAKRHFGVKDSSSLIPGHGGVLDRFDGLVAATLIAAAVTHWRGQAVFIW